MNNHARQCQSIAVPFVLFFAFVAVSTGLLLPTAVWAEDTITIIVDDRVEVHFARVKSEHKDPVKRGLVEVTNVSTTDILAPLRLVITEFKDNKYQLANADGFTEGGQPYIDIELDGDRLPHGETSLWTELEFIKLKSQKSKRSKKSQKPKKSNKSRKSQKSWESYPLKVKFDFEVIGDVVLIPVAPQVGVDDRVSVSLSPLETDKKALVYTTDVIVTNESAQKILSPIRVIINVIGQANTAVSNADGYVGSSPYIEIELPGGKLEQGEQTPLVAIVFERTPVKSVKSKNSVKSKKSGKSKKSSKYSTFEFDFSVSGGAVLAPQAPTSLPYALSPADGLVDVRFSLGILNEGGSVIGDVFLKNLAEAGPGAAMNDEGINGDQVAGDGIYGVILQGIDAGALSGGQCLSYVGLVIDGELNETLSTVYLLCATSFPTRVAESNIEPENIVVLDGGLEVVANEVLIFINQGTSEADITSLVEEIGGTVVGTVLPINQYQVRLDTALNADELDQLIGRLNNESIVAIAASNGLIEASASANDTEFANQYGLKAIHADDTWDVGATGAGITVIVLDEGVDATLLDFVGPQVLPGGGNTDATGHGTQMAGIIAATTDNQNGVAGIARDAQIRSVAINITTNAEFNQGINDAATVAGSIVNISLNNTSPFGGYPGLCQSINNVIESMAGKVVVNSAGNKSSNGAWWPGNCNSASADSFRIDILEHLAFDRVANKERFIVVSATDCNTNECTDPNSHRATSNYGPWVDVAAPGSNVPTLQTTDLGGSTTTISGTSPAAAIASAAAANLLSCGFTLDNVESALEQSAVIINYPDGVSRPRIDLYAALDSVNVAPSGVELSGNMIDENVNTSDGSVIGSLATVDATVCDTHSYAILSGGDGVNFSIGGTDNDQLMLTAGTLNFEGKQSYSVTVQSTDYFDAAPTSQLFTVNVIDLNEAPSIAAASRSIDENTANGTVVGLAIPATDPDALSSLTYAITGGAFNIDNSGQIRVANSAALDFETTPVFNLTVEVTDNGAPGLSASAVVTVSLNDLNDAPKIEPQQRSVDENSVIGTTVGTPIVASDPDIDSSLSYAITAGNTVGAFAINSSGQITVASSTALDYETTQVFNLSVQVTDNGTPGLIDIATVTVNLNDINEAPSISPQQRSINENTTNGTIVGAPIAASDPDANNSLTYSIIGGNTGNAFAIANSGQISVANSAALDFETRPVFSLTVQVTDNGTPGLTAVASVTVNLNNVNEAPSISLQLRSIDENAPNGSNVVGPIAASDPDAGSNLTFAITGGNTGGAFTIINSGQIRVLNSAALDFETTPIFFLTVQVVDEFGLSDSAIVTVNLNDLAPTPFALAANSAGGTVPENNGGGATFSLTVPVEEGGTINNVTLDLVNFVRNGTQFLPPSGGIVELKIRLTHVDTGTTASIISSTLNAGRFICIAGLNGDYRFDSGAGTTLNAACGTGGVSTQPRTIAAGSFRPRSNLSTLFDGEDAAGTWTLFVSDTVLNTFAGQFVTNSNWSWRLNIAGESGG